MRINVPFTSRSSSCRRKSAVVVGGGDGGGGCAVAVVAAASPAAAPASAPAVLVLLLLPLMPLVVVVIVAVSQLFKLECLLSCQLLELRLLLMSSKTGVFVVASRSLSLSLSFYFLAPALCSLCRSFAPVFGSVVDCLLAFVVLFLVGSFSRYICLASTDRDHAVRLLIRCVLVLFDFVWFASI